MRLKSWGATFSTPTVFAKFLTTYQTTFSVRPSPQTTPFLLMHRNNRPDVVPDAWVHPSIFVLGCDGYSVFGSGHRNRESIDPTRHTRHGNHAPRPFSPMPK